MWYSCQTTVLQNVIRVYYVLIAKNVKIVHMFVLMTQIIMCKNCFKKLQIIACIILFLKIKILKVNNKIKMTIDNDIKEKNFQPY